MRLALKSILQERDEQDKQWGGPLGDDSNELHDWCDYIDKQKDRIIYPAISPESYIDEIRSRYVKIAALALAAIESIDRKYGGI